MGTIHYDEEGNPIEKEVKPKRQYIRKKKPVPGAMAEDDLENVVIPQDTAAFLPTTLENGDSQTVTPSTAPEELAVQAKTEAEKAENEEKKEEMESPAKPQPRVKSKTPQRAKPSKTLLQFSKKKRKRSNSEGSGADMDATPPPSPPDESSGIEKRRSGRNTGTKRKKYIDDVQMTFSDEDIKGLPTDVSGVASAAMLEDLLGPVKEPVDVSADNSLLLDGDVVSSGQSGPNYAFIDPTAEDTMIVQYILTSRMGTRELED